MKESFWKWLAVFIVSRPTLVNNIIGYAEKRPYFHLIHDDGLPYMDRWWIMPRCLLTFDENGNLFPHKWVPLIIRLHHILTCDYDRDLHDHPADYRTILLRGAYLEEDVYGKRKLIQAGETKCARAETFHRIHKVSFFGVWTIFIMAKKHNEWGFIVNGHKVPWRKYSGRKHFDEVSA